MTKQTPLSISLTKPPFPSCSSKHQAVMENLTINDENIKEGECSTPVSIDFISQMPDDILVIILSRLPLKQAVVTDCLSTRWRFVWCYMKKLDIDGTEMLDKMVDKDEQLCVLEWEKYINMVNSVIKSHTHPMLKSFRICFDLDKTYSKDIDDWLRFALDKKVEYLQLDLSALKNRDTKENYDFALPLSDGSMARLSDLASSDSVGVETLSLEQVFLLHVNVSEVTFSELLNHSPHLEILYIYDTDSLTHIDFGGRDLKLKEFMLMGCLEVQSVAVYDCDLKRFVYLGHDIEIRFKNLHKVKEVDVGLVSVGLSNKVFRMISSVASSLQALSLNIDRELEDLLVNAIPRLPKIKKLKLTLSTQQHDSLLEFTEIAKACPRLETFIISLHWCRPTRRVKAWHEPLAHSFEHLKHFEIGGYIGQNSDYQFALYMIGNAASSLKKFVIDTSLHPYDDVLTAEEALLRERAGRSHAKYKLSPCLPSWVELVIH